MPHHNYRKIHPTYKISEPTKTGLLFFGGLSGYKGIFDLLDLFSAITKEQPNIYLTIAGRTNSSVKKFLDSRIETLGIADKVRLIERFIESDELEELAKQHAGILLPYRHITNSGTLIHALTLGKRIYMRKSALTDDLLKHNHCLAKTVYAFSDEKELTSLVSNTFKEPADLAGIAQYLNETDIEKVCQTYYSKIFS